MKGKWEDLFCNAMLVFGGVVVGFAFGLIYMMGQTRRDVAMIESCRHQVEFVEDMEEPYKSRFFRINGECPALETQWRITKAIAAVEPAENTP